MYSTYIYIHMFFIFIYQHVYTYKSRGSSWNIPAPKVFWSHFASGIYTESPGFIPDAEMQRFVLFLFFVFFWVCLLVNCVPSVPLFQETENVFPNGESTRSRRWLDSKKVPTWRGWLNGKTVVSMVSSHASKNSLAT